MKLKINKACDLSSISVLPPHSRRSSLAPTGPQGPQSSQLRSQSSQQSFSQGLSSQHGLFSQFSQSSLDDVVTNDQRVNSQERENAVKKFSCLPPVSYTREESQMPITRSSNNLIRKWNTTSASDQRSQISEELERRFGMLDTSLNRFGMILDSVQSDLMQVNRGTKDVSLEMEKMRQKLGAYDISMQLMNKRQEDIKTSIDGGLKSLSDQLRKDIYQDQFKKILLMLSTLPEQIEASLMKLQIELCNIFAKEMQAMASSLKSPNHNGQVATTKKRAGRCATQQKRPRTIKSVPPKICGKSTEVLKVELGGWNSVKKERATIRKRIPANELKKRGVSSIGQNMSQARECRISIDSDEDIEGGFSCLINQKETDYEIKLIEDVKEETEQILRRARRQRRKYSNPIIID
ncbi:hypothetical protein Dsin_026098 [Dipteronia sinensis]|uniref:Recombination initiation defects 3 n=1 Tax=Dipteronia sinensis TaxID=43782 RepID=A0AAD9ZYN5_9ROSI|nr:hypothetical protein Dsin_026098 [Dipteronia sinensis]